MKVLLVNKFHYRKGGSETYYFEVADALRDMGHEVVFFAMDGPLNEPCPQSKYFVSASDYNGKTSVFQKAKEAASIAYNREAKEKFEQLLKAERPDVIHLNLVHRQITLSILDAPSAVGIPVVFTSHDYILVCPNYTMLDESGCVCDDCLGGDYSSCLKKRCVKGSRAKSALAVHEANYIKRRGLYGKIDRFIAPSAFMAREIVRGGIPKERVVTMVNFAPESPAETSESTYAARGQDPYFLYFGRLSPEKGVDVLIEAFAKAASRIAGDWKLVIAGEGPDRENLEAMAKAQGCSRVDFVGYRSGDDLQSLIVNARYSVCPSVWNENMPYSIIEALASGTPVIGSEIGGIPEMVIPGQTGFLSRPGSAEDLGNVLADAANVDGRTYEKMQEECRGHVSRRCDRAAYMEELVGLYEELIREKSHEGR